jgi:hypothetical protein
VSLSAIVRAAADDLAALEERCQELERLNDLLLERIDELEAGSVEEIRQAYRKGYRAGWGTGKAGRDAETAPERHARTGIRRALGVGSPHNTNRGRAALTAGPTATGGWS